MYRQGVPEIFVVNPPNQALEPGTGRSQLLLRRNANQPGSWLSFNVSSMKTVFGIVTFMALDSLSAAHDAGTLLICTLKVESSYSLNLERPATIFSDTVQWWIPRSGAWRIKTYAIDADIHPYRLETKAPASELRALALQNTRKHYGDVLERIIEVEIPENASDEVIASLFKKSDLKGNHEWVAAGYLLYLPDDRHYTTKTEPKKD